MKTILPLLCAFVFLFTAACDDKEKAPAEPVYYDLKDYTLDSSRTWAATPWNKLVVVRNPEELMIYTAPLLSPPRDIDFDKITLLLVNGAQSYTCIGVDKELYEVNGVFYFNVWAYRGDWSHATSDTFHIACLAPKIPEDKEVLLNIQVDVYEEN